MFDSTWRRWSWRAGTASALAVALFAVGSPAGAQETVDLADVFNPLVVKALQGADISTELTPLGLSSDDPWFDEPEIEPGTAPRHTSQSASGQRAGLPGPSRRGLGSPTHVHHH
ncbi:hypothetical protein [Rhodococcus qingshengii]|uniref:hypothetical protein n=1 Tax=Rhodococcus qingshengii TaxID=334542 RepID=UPI001F140C30|nr:hypothetical protein [Rhodococcus qingshengii]ULD43186.1 hypothetical protein JKI97_09240 [Rhodococcus qingshengii]